VATKESDRSLPDLLTVTAIALVAYAASNVWHEAVGHGGACVALGGKPNVLSSVHFDCGEEAISALASRGVAAAGTIANFIAGAIGLVALKATNPERKPHIAYFLWLFTTLNLLMGAGYFLFSGVGNIGDWADVASGTGSPLIWRPAMTVLGGALYFLLARRSGQWLGALAGSDDHTPIPRHDDSADFIGRQAIGNGEESSDPLQIGSGWIRGRYSRFDFSA